MPCAICQREDVPLTREHVFARWLTQRVGSAGPHRALATVCADCNAGWMSTLEQAFRRAAFARRTGPIPAPDRTTLSRWFTKTALLLADVNGVVLVDRAGRAALMRGMPDGLDVFIARRRRSGANLGYGIDVAGADLTSVTVVVDDLVAHVAADGVLTRRAGTRLWPMRTRLVRWDTLPVAGALT